MKERKTLAQLGEEYERNLEFINEKISALRAKLRALPDPILSNEAYAVKCSLNMYYEMRAEVAHTAHYLKNYYNKTGGRNFYDAKNY